MKTQKHLSPAIAIPLVALSLALSLLVSAAPPASMDPLQALPEGALFVVSAGNPGRIMANALAFTRKAALPELEAPLARVLEALEGKGDLPLDLVDLAAHIDWSRRLVLAVYAPEAGSGARPGLLAYIPTSDPPMVQEAILRASEAAGEQTSTSLALSGYVMVAMGREAPGDLDFKRSEVQALAAYPASSLATWVDVEAGKEYVALLTQGLSSIFGSGSSYSDDDETWDDEWDGDWDWESGDWDTEDPALGMSNDWSGLAGLNSLGSLMDGAEGVLEDLVEVLKDIRFVDFGLIIEADRIWGRSGLSVAPGGTLYRMSIDAASGQLPLPYLPYLEMDALVSMTWSTKADWAMGILETLYGTILPDEALLGKALTAMKASMAATGSNGAMTFDFRMSAELASAIKSGSPSGDAAIPLLGRGLTFDAAGVLQLSDRQGFRDALRESLNLVEGPSYLDMLKDSNLALQANRRVGTMDGLPYDKYEYDIHSTDEGSMADGVLEIFRAIAGPLLSPVYVYRGDKAYIGFGKPETLRGFIGRDRATRPLQTASRFKALRGGAPADARGLLYLSTGNLMRRIMQVLPEEKSILPFGYGDLYGVLGWISATPGHLGIGLGLGAEDIKAFRSLPD